MTIQKNCIVTLDYTVFDTENNLLDSGAQSLVYLHGGYGDIFEKIEKALEGKSVGESIHMQLSPKEAFGEYKQELVLIEERSMFEDDLEVGQNVEMVFSEDADDEIMLSYTVIEILEDRVILDANHPLAGVTILFDGTVIGVREATNDEIEKRLFSHEESLSVMQN
ncbi:putative FKBP-type peptidyl-prolyl cis-trans isomerase [Sulfurospirillum diekertiae]|uniref:Peptidyl-prolyl cis-trans isomerase n=1 Tax=Sulfurospirillum diekertiae TaxID=1854492 RepID=A0A290HVI6_9BACT|nr:peptidylprolyl isomerase [Sulfurospirillum diekertiae]ATB69680.1 putative FKBP-type peptidyl-prolyl cis-trans isomerase [Sulfurospirillum diekertiae]